MNVARAARIRDQLDLRPALLAGDGRCAKGAALDPGFMSTPWALVARSSRSSVGWRVLVAREDRTRLCHLGWHAFVQWANEGPEGACGTGSSERLSPAIRSIDRLGPLRADQKIVPRPGSRQRVLSTGSGGDGSAVHDPSTCLSTPGLRRTYRKRGLIMSSSSLSRRSPCFRVTRTPRRCDRSRHDPWMADRATCTGHRARSGGPCP